MGCPDNSFKYLSSEANARETLVKVGAIDNQDKIIDKNKFKEQAKRFLDYVKKEFKLDVVSVITGRNMVAQFNRDVFSKIDKARGYDKINKQTINNGLNPVKEIVKLKKSVVNVQQISKTTPINNLNLTNEQYKKLDSFQLYEDKETLCGEGICNYTAHESTKKLEEVGLNPYPNQSGTNLPVKVKSPLGEFLITHFVSAVAINNNIYIYDMPQHEFISDEFFGRGDLDLKTTYKPRLIPLTLDDIKSNYDLSLELSANFIRSILKNSGSNISPTFENYIRNNIKNSEDYIKLLEEQITEQGLKLDTYLEYQNEQKERRKLERDFKKSKLETKTVTSEEEQKVINFLRNKLKLKVKDYLPRKVKELDIKGIINSVIGNSIRLDYTENIPKILEDLQKGLKNKDFVNSVWNNYVSSINQAKSLQDSVEYVYSFSRLLNGFLKSANSIGFDKALKEYDKTQQYKLRSLFRSDIKTKYASEKQMIFLVKKRYSNLDNLTKDLNLYLNPFNELKISKIIAEKKVDKYNTLINYLKLTNFDVDYIYTSLENEINRKNKYFIKNTILDKEFNIDNVANELGLDKKCN